jgi:DNA-binding GntR family transcriptional regulator
MSQTLTVTRKESVLRQLRTEIVNGQLVPGTVLKDAEVAARVGLSITPVREAIAQLASEGLIDVAPNRTRKVTQLTSERALDLVDVMTELACVGLAWGMRNLTRADLLVARRHYENFAAGLRRGDVTEAVRAGAEIGRTFVRASGNSELQAHIDLVVARSVRLLAVSRESPGWPLWLDGFRETLALLDAGELDAAMDRYRRMYAEFRLCVQNLALD